MKPLGSPERPLRVAVVGSGPGGFYAAAVLLKARIKVLVDLFERLPAPHGLVRFGVAPDHPQTRRVTLAFDRAANMPGFRFLGNVTVGRDISVDELRRFYDAVLVATGMEQGAPLGIAGEDLPGCYTADEFAYWYNGHPDYADREFDLAGPEAVVIGHGNVGLDVARILARTHDELKHTDMTARAVESLSRSRVRHIHLVGRRGPVQVRMTQQEMAEISELTACNPVIRPEDLVLDPASQAELDDPGNFHSQRNLPVFRRFAQGTRSNKARHIHFRFLLSPIEIRGAGHVESVVFERNRLEGEPFALQVVPTGEFEEVRCGLVFRAVGHRGSPLPGLPFDPVRSVIPNECGRVVRDGGVVPGLYVAGWIKRGPNGLIGTERADSTETADIVVADAATLPPCPEPNSEAVLGLLRQRDVRVVSYADWRLIDAAELARGQAAGKLRERLTSAEEMLALLEGPR